MITSTDRNYNHSNLTINIPSIVVFQLIIKWFDVNITSSTVNTNCLTHFQMFIKVANFYCPCEVFLSTKTFVLLLYGTGWHLNYFSCRIVNSFSNMQSQIFNFLRRCVQRLFIAAYYALHSLNVRSSHLHCRGLSCNRNMKLFCIAHLKFAKRMLRITTCTK